jgi:type II secretory pathway pseudopilin PulG
MIPVFVAMMIFALVANAVASNYSIQQRAIIINSAENQLGTTISQLYYTLSQTDILPSNVTKTNPLPEQIDGQNYSVNGTLTGNVLSLTFNFPGLPLHDTTHVNLGPNVHWDASKRFDSTNPKAVIIVQKKSSGELWISFR